MPNARFCFHLFYRLNGFHPDPHRLAAGPGNQSWHNWFKKGKNFKNDKRLNGFADGGISDASGDGVHFNQNWDECVVLEEAQTDITTGEEYAKFNFQVIYKILNCEIYQLIRKTNDFVTNLLIY